MQILNRLQFRLGCVHEAGARAVLTKGKFRGQSAEVTISLRIGLRAHRCELRWAYTDPSKDGGQEGEVFPR